MSVAIALLGGISGKVWLGIAVAAIAAGALLWARRGGEQAVQTADLKREVADTHTATAIANQVAHETGDQARADLDKGFSR